ncbi:MAG: hypothetical protein PHN60_01400 [Candidatus Gracilibacteria bacterium]|nr:hypothetical protein [Candidatus Gracilibacteria bacterium]
MKHYLALTLLSSLLLTSCSVDWNDGNVKKIGELEKQVTEMKSDKDLELQKFKLEKQKYEEGKEIDKKKEEGKKEEISGQLKEKGQSLTGVIIPKSSSDQINTNSRNLELEQIYKKSSFLPDHTIICIPLKKLVCDEKGGCKNIEPTVFNLISKAYDPIFMRCDEKGCDSYETNGALSGLYRILQPKDTDKGFVFKMSLDSDKHYVEITTFGIQSYISYGYCKHNSEF